MADEIIERLTKLFPPIKWNGRATTHKCDECDALSEVLEGSTWFELDNKYIKNNSDVLPLLSKEAYAAFLPAWIKEGMLDPNGDVAGMLLVNLGDDPPTQHFTNEQCKLILSAAKNMIENSIYGKDDPSNIESLENIKEHWGKAA